MTAYTASLDTVRFHKNAKTTFHRITIISRKTAYNEHSYDISNNINCQYLASNTILNAVVTLPPACFQGHTETSLAPLKHYHFLNA